MDNSPAATITKARAGNPADDSEEVGESQDEEEPSSFIECHNVESELDNFRQQWKREIEQSPAKSVSLQKNVLTNAPEAIEEKARCLFLSGVQAERNRNLQDAISFYRRAVQLVPDIEFRINDQDDSLFSTETDDESLSDESRSSDDDEDVEIDNLVSKFQKWAIKVGTTSICQPKHMIKGSHISSLPPEIFLYILKWVVSQDLDLFSLEQVSRVCRGFYVCARDPELWKLACLSVWDISVDNPNRYDSWRNMFIQRPHVSFNGVYISKTTYVRYGEPSFQDSHYKPCYLVEYYRYLRFFPEGLVLMLTTPDDPYQSIKKLSLRKFRDWNILSGRYKLVGNTVIAVVKKPKLETVSNYFRYRKQRQVNPQDSGDQTFHLELNLKNVRNRYNYQLTWSRYSIHMAYRNGEETVSDFDLNPSNFPPFWFSRVRSYTAESESPLK